MTALPLMRHAIDMPPVPWRNGLGRTRELFAWPDAEHWQARVSLADMEADAPFSAFPGVMRWFAIAKGAGVDLQVGATQHRVTRESAPLSFDGGADTSGRLVSGPVQCLNLMLRGALGHLETVHDDTDWAPHAPHCGLFAAVGGECVAGNLVHAVDAHTLLVFDAPPPTLRFRALQRPAVVTGWWLAFTPDAASA